MGGNIWEEECQVVGQEVLEIVRAETVTALEDWSRNGAAWAGRRHWPGRTSPPQPRLQSAN